MRNVNEIIKDARISYIIRNIYDEERDIVQLMMVLRSNKSSKDITAKFSSAMGWEHLSVSMTDETPSWDIMNELKEMFWTDEEECMQFHPKKDNYINNHEHCLHIWRSLDQQFNLPPTILVGIRPNHMKEDEDTLIKLQEEIGNPINPEMLKLILKGAADPKEIEKELKNMSFEQLVRLMTNERRYY